MADWAGHNNTFSQRLTILYTGVIPVQSVVVVTQVAVCPPQNISDSNLPYAITCQGPK